MMGDRLRASFVLLHLNFLSTHCFIFNKSPPSENLNSVDNATSMILDNILPTAETMEQKTENEYNKVTKTNEISLLLQLIHRWKLLRRKPHFLTMLS